MGFNSGFKGLMSADCQGGKTC